MDEVIQSNLDTVLCHRCHQLKSLSEFCASRVHHPWRPCRTCRTKERAAREPKPIPTSYLCSKCGVQKDSSCFYLRTAKDGRPKRERADCRECVKQHNREYRAQNRERVRANARRWASRNRRNTKKTALKTLYGISLEDYEAMLKAQNGLCAICHLPPDNLGKAKTLFVDHDHETDQIRGLLCRVCNFGIGSFRDNPELLDVAAIYLRRKK